MRNSCIKFFYLTKYFFNAQNSLELVILYLKLNLMLNVNCV